ncbi:MAG: 2'-5' RNA ligase family protein [Parvibaculum sp.]|uniref:2'-5' RNA ligase family protein n=1 Tax=Parvibaculum sp. TaxID=2024848 RepID=UPI00284AC809|nr:2'-5' RNA ligase family protein [Parvibaculum sp.]MDR3498911.1 2'-5' RNA ligase family protein [Parvibaculum sp.]
METALVLCIPEAEELVSSWRLRHDPSALAGMPAHITLVYPFKPYEEIDAAVEADLARLFAQGHALDITFHHTRRFPRVLWLAPERPEPIAAIVRALGLVFPGHLPYGGAFPDTVPHLTVADLSRGQASDLDAIEREFLAEARRRLPLAARVETATLMYKSDGGGWHEAKRFTLGGQTAAA